MSKKTYFENWRVEVTPKAPYVWPGRTKDAIARQWRENCEEIKANIERHVDGYNFVEIKKDRLEVCQFCGSKWTEISDDYNGGCCREDQDAEDRRGQL